jgi:hypothetical protein
MLIWITSESVKNIATNYSEVIPVLELLATACREGKHIIAGDRKAFESIATSNHIAPETQKLYNNLYRRLPTLSPIRDELFTYIEVLGKTTTPIIDRLDGKYIIKLPITFFCDSYNIQKTILLCENLEDAKFYDFIAMAYKHHIEMPNLLTKFEEVNGGGDTTALVYKQKASSTKDERRLVLCILDSDKVAPHSSRGSTANKVRTFHENKCSLLESLASMKYHILESRELENIIPFTYIQKAFDRDVNKLQVIDSLQKFHHNSTRGQDTNLEQAYLFLDIKEGTSLNKIISKLQDSKDKIFWEEIAKKIINNYLNCLANESCNETILKDSKHSKDKKFLCSPCSISLGLGSQTLDKINEWIANNEKNTLAEDVWNHLSLSQQSEWEKIGRLLVSWGAALSLSKDFTI